MVVFLGVLLGIYVAGLIGRILRCIGIYTKNYKISDSSHIRLYRIVCTYLIFGGPSTYVNKSRVYLYCPLIIFILCIFNYFFIDDVLSQFSLLLLFSLLLMISIIDFETKLIPDILSYCVFWLGVFVQYKQGVGQLTDGLCVAVVVYIALKLLQQIYLLGFGREALGDADPLLAFAACIWLDFQLVPYLFLLAVFVTLVPILFFRRLGSSLLTIQIPFGPGLAFASFSLIEFKFLGF